MNKLQRLNKLQNTFNFSSKTSDAEISKLKARPFEEIPGPKALPVIGTLYKYLPIIGEYSFKSLPENGKKKFEKYGPLVKEEIVKGEPIVWVFRPQDIAEVFKADNGRYPERRSHRALYKYRIDRPQVYNTGGLLTENGPEWWKIRKEFQKSMTKPQSIIRYIPKINEVVSKFVKLCESNKLSDTQELLYRLFLDLTCLVAFDYNINSFSDEEMKNDSVSSKLLDAALTTNGVTLVLDNGLQMYKFFNTPKYRKLCKAQSFMESIATKFVTEKLNSLKNSKPDENRSLLEAWLLNPNLDFKDVVGMASDMLLAAIETTSYSSAFCLYHLATNQEAQEKLAYEARKLVPNYGDSITAETLKNASFTKAVIKESFRLSPISVGVGRILQDDIVLNGYIVKKGTNVVTQNQISCLQEQYFENPHSFIPERWLRDSKQEKSTIHPYLVLPFGHGPRSCIARRLAEQNEQILLIQMCRHLKFTWNGKKLGMDSFIINKPDGPIEINYKRRA